MRVLSIVHEAGPTGGGGIFERAVPERGDRLDRWVAADGEAPPGTPSDWDAVMVFGGAMHPDQDGEHPWLAGEAGFIETALADGVPLLGVCLGAQLIARAAGASVGPSGSPEVGWFEVARDDGCDDPVVGVLPDRFRAFQWHYYTFDLPPGAALLAASDAARQAYRLGDRVWGIQFHAEVDRRMLDHWLREGREELPKPVEELRAETDRYLPTWNEQGKALCEAFLAEALRLSS
ncbi:MAG TPA: type 1 glutamine amidotransferase [Gaiella sp.]|jgi:GMP synthase-like glutamine amidotransferase|nr:type 1 glutamine amidotransferase [Gaiella sp.]